MSFSLIAAIIIMFGMNLNIEPRDTMLILHCTSLLQLSHCMDTLNFKVALLWTEISLQILDRLLKGFVQTFMVSKGWILITLVISWLFLYSATMRLIFFCVWVKCVDKLLDGFPWHLLQMFMVPLGWTAVTLLRLQSVQYFDIWANTFKMNDIILCCTLCSEL